MKKISHYLSVAALVLISILLVLASSSQALGTNKPSRQTLNFYGINGIYYYNPEGSCIPISYITGNGDFASIMNAKNAYRQATDFPAINLNSTSGIKTTLENYGDLAYQLGHAVGAPWIAILVQAQFEDPNPAVACGKNNFWGNGCPPGTPVGGASIQGANLGEGFAQYGKTLTNGYHNQALGEGDPIRFLEKIGPTWVQGNINGAGYGSIEQMKQRVRAIEAFIATPEGQAIVNSFGGYISTDSSSSSLNYCVGNSSGSSSSVTATNVGESAKVPENSRLSWLFPDGIPTNAKDMQKYMTTIQVPILDQSGKRTTMSLTVHNKLASEYMAVFEDLVKAGFRVKPSTTASYVYRNISNSSKLSRHSYGAAIDLNWNDNPKVTNTSTYKSTNSDPYKIDDEIVSIWRQHGFYWGGCFSSYSDIMHFDYIDKGSTNRYSICESQ